MKNVKYAVVNSVVENKQPLLISPSGKKALSFWAIINNEELHALRADKELLGRLNVLSQQDPFYYVSRVEESKQSVFSNTKGSITLPVNSLRLGEFIRM